MTLPDITGYIPKVELPFDIPILLHPLVVHFMIAVPVIVLLLELTNLITKKKAVGVVSFVLLLLAVILSVGAYLTGLVDGKEGFEVLTEAGKTELAEHKLLGIYLLLASVVVLLFKLLSAAMSSGIMKSLYILVLIGFVVAIFNQGKDGGELVYEHGMNVKQVKALDDKIFDLEEALEEAQEKIAKDEKKVEETDAPVVPQPTPEVIQEKTPEVPQATPEESTPVETVVDTTPAPQQSIEAVKTEVKEELVPYTEPIQVEQMPEAAQQVKIPTH